METEAKFEAHITATVIRADGTTEEIEVQQPTAEEAAAFAAHLGVDQ